MLMFVSHLTSFQWRVKGCCRRYSWRKTFISFMLYRDDDYNLFAWKRSLLGRNLHHIFNRKWVFDEIIMNMQSKSKCLAYIYFFTYISLSIEV